MNRKKRFDSYSNTFLDINHNDRITKSIFVSIVSYEDSNIIRTINSAIANAKRPENIYIGISIINSDNLLIEELKKINNRNINIKFIYEDKNITYGKMKNYSNYFYNKEDFYLSISSSSEFDPFWDDILIKQYTTIHSLINEKIVFTSDPRGWLPHDNVVNGYVYFTNHKTNVSMQREVNDSCYIPTSGYHQQITENHLLNNSSLYREDRDASLYMTEVSKSEKFLNEYGFVKFCRRRFFDDEFISKSFGVSCNFIFSSAKEFIKNNPIAEYILDEEDYNFNSFLNLLDNNCEVFSIRYLPIYHLYDDVEVLYPKRLKISDKYNNDEIKELRNPIIERIKNIENMNIDRIKLYSYIFSVDWNERKFKIRKNSIFSHLENIVNLFISMYNFSLNENSLHWNRIDK